MEPKHQLQTVVVKPDNFDSLEFDFKDVVSMKILTGGSEVGEMIINNVSYTSG